ncbi:DUF1868 domain-containing protein [Auritidibacter sp. NML130574]|uniref:DUF1868 domain-containing protein n=1 Tax=Auritidibacter TaxID=1160973 RepID=UPI000D735A48|nr:MULTISPECIES: DUF1868 domain-containing protein [Auritidibacter]AXR74008.1 DUF1868 domain-containing protein [Auritidibacter sp. NML130574]
MSSEQNGEKPLFFSPNRGLSDQLRSQLGQPPVQEAKAPRRKWITAEEPNPFLGWTIVSPVPLDSSFIDPAHRLLKELREDYQPGEWSIHPLSSLHMTVFAGETQYDLQDAGRSVSDRLDEITARIRQLSFPDLDLVVKVTGFVLSNDTATATVVPASEDIAQVLRTFRDEVAELTGFRRSDHDTVRFHITFAYRLTAAEQGTPIDIAATEDRYTRLLREAGDIELGRPAYNIFESMTSFPPTYSF